MTDKDLKKLAVKKPQLAKLTRNSSKNTGMSFNTISINETPQETKEKFTAGMIKVFVTNVEQLALFQQND